MSKITTTVAIVVRRSKTLIHANPRNLCLNVKDKVLVETNNGLECGVVVEKEKATTDTKRVTNKVIKKFSMQDFYKLHENKKAEKEAYKICRDKIKNKNLLMKLTCVEYTFQREKLLIYYTATKRVDFRELIKELADALKTKIQMVQIGVRDEAKMIGGFGHCGKELCCMSFLKNLTPVSFDVAKNQTGNANKISGICGKLICCIKFETDCTTCNKDNCTSKTKDEKSS
jgi:cell fate regulator YaaT (PSP1 superfamily)